MCPRHHVSTKPKHGDFELLKRIIDRLEGAEEISLVGLGEPFTHPMFSDIVKYSKTKGLLTKVTTNGLLLNSDEKLELLILSGLDTISFSIESIDEFERSEQVHNNLVTLKHIKKLIEIKKILDAKKPKIVLQTIMIKNKEKDIYDIINWADRYGIDRVNILRMTKYFETGIERPNTKEEKKIFKQVAKLRKKHKIRIDCLQDQFYTGVKGYLYKHFKKFLRLDSFCMRLLDYPYITRDGDMIPCCVLPDCNFGNVLERDIKDIWLGKKFNMFRRTHNNNKICSKCDNLRLKQIV